VSAGVGSSAPRTASRRFLVIATVAVVCLAGLGFFYKLFELAASFLAGETSFALGPVSVYLAVAGGFLCLFVWATLRGQFHDIEAPKMRMLEREAALDEAEGAGPGASAGDTAARRLEAAFARAATSTSTSTSRRSEA
jgi:cbb3-type cytochrome oxidase maturation protein